MATLTEVATKGMLALLISPISKSEGLVALPAGRGCIRASSCLALVTSSTASWVEVRLKVDLPFMEEVDTRVDMAFKVEAMVAFKGTMVPPEIMVSWATMATKAVIVAKVAIAEFTAQQNANLSNVVAATSDQPGLSDTLTKKGKKIEKLRCYRFKLKHLVPNENFEWDVNQDEKNKFKVMFPRCMDYTRIPQGKHIFVKDGFYDLSFEVEGSHQVIEDHVMAEAKYDGGNDDEHSLAGGRGDIDEPDNQDGDGDGKRSKSDSSTEGAIVAGESPEPKNNKVTKKQMCVGVIFSPIVQRQFEEARAKLRALSAQIVTTEVKELKAVSDNNRASEVGQGLCPYRGTLARTDCCVYSQGCLYDGRE
ncbi:hypothetical protein ACQ4PT_053078 [Festuca glaucescens]